MGTYEQLKAAVAAVIKENGAEEITGDVLQQVLLTIINSVGAGATFAGVATPTTAPSTPDAKMFYLAGKAGTYTNFNITITKGLWVFENSTGSWVGHDLEVSMLFASGEDVTQTNIAAQYAGAGNSDLVTVGVMNEAIDGIIGDVALSALDSTRTAGLYRVIGVQSRVVGYLQVNMSLSGTYVIQFLASDISDFDDGYTADYKGHILTRTYSISAGTWTAWDEYGGGKFATGEKVANVSIVQTLGNSQDALPSQKTVTDAVLNLIDIGNIDAMKNDATLRTGAAIARYTATATLQGVTYKVGILDVMSDSAGHVLTQILTTHYTITNGVLDTSSHTDGAIRQYYRSVKINGGTLPTTDWTLWKPINDEQFDAISESVESLAARIGYYECSTAAATAAKTVAATGYTLENGGCIRIKMDNANTADNATLNINSTGAKALYYGGVQASSTNSWEAGEVLEVYYDGTQYQCVSGGDAEGIGYDNLISGLTATNVQGAVDEIVGMLMEWGDMNINTMSDYLAFRGIRKISGRWWWCNDGSPYSYTIPINGGAAFKIKANNTNAAQYTFLTSNNRGSGYYAPAFATGYSSVLDITAGTEIVVNAPADATYLYLTQKIGTTDYTPAALYGKVNKLDELDEVIGISEVQCPIDLASAPYKQFAIELINNSYYWEGHDYNSFSFLFDVRGVKSVSIKANATNAAWYTFLKSDNRKAGNYMTPVYASGYTGLVSITADTMEEGINVPSDAVYLYLHQYVTSTDYTPSQLLLAVPTTSKVLDNSSNIQRLENSIDTIYWGDNKAFYDIDLTQGDLSEFNDNANWSADSNGLTCNSVGVGNAIYTTKISSMSQKMTRLRFNMTSNAVIALCWANTGSSNGSYFSVDAANGVMSIHNNYTGTPSTIPTILSSAEVAIVNGREYIMEAVKERHNNTLRLYDGLSGAKIAELTANQSSDSSKEGGHQIGNIGIACTAGTVHVTRLQVVFDYIRPLIAIWGDSITEGDKVMQGVTYGDLMKDYFGQSRVVTSGKSGDNTNGAITRLTNEISLLNPMFGMVCIGTNGGMDSYQALDLIALIKSAGAVPILCVIPMGSPSSTSVRTLITGLDVLTVRFDIATALNNDVSQGANTSLFVSDGLHPNADGHKAMFDRIKVDLPFLFNYK